MLSGEQGNKGLKIKGTGEHSQFWGAGNMENQDFILGEQENKAIFSRGPREPVLLWKGLNYVPHRRGGGILFLVQKPLALASASASASEWRRRRRQRRSLRWGDTFLFACSLMNRWVDFNQICMDITLGHDEELIRFW